MRGSVYLLSCEPHSDKYYIGITKRALHKRLYEHLNIRKNDKRACWVKSLQNKGLTPLIEEIDFIETDSMIEMESELNRLEVFYIALFKSWNIKLVNNGDGGRQNLNHRMPESAKEKLRIAHTGKKLSKEHSAKAANTLRKYALSLTELQKKAKALQISKKLKGHLVSEGTRALMKKNGKRHYGNTHCAKLSIDDVYEIITLLKQGKLCREIALLYGVHTSNISAIKNKRGWKNIWYKDEQTKTDFDIKRHHSKEFIEIAVADYIASDLNVNELAKKYKISNRCLSQWITDSGNKIVPRKSIRSNGQAGKRCLAKSKEIIDINNGRIYVGIKSILDIFPHFGYKRLSKMLSGHLKNKTSFRYVKDDAKEKQYNKAA